jgi:hypothetical protein
MNMKAHIYTIEDEYMGIPLTIEGELLDFEDENLPFIVVQEINFKDKPLELWTVSDRYIEHLKNRIFQTWCSEVCQNGARSC